MASKRSQQQSCHCLWDSCGITEEGLGDPEALWTLAKANTGHTCYKECFLVAHQPPFCSSWLDMCLPCPAEPRHPEVAESGGNKNNSLQPEMTCPLIQNKSVAVGRHSFQMVLEKGLTCPSKIRHRLHYFQSCQKKLPQQRHHHLGQMLSLGVNNAKSCPTNIQCCQKKKWLSNKINFF